MTRFACLVLLRLFNAFDNESLSFATRRIRRITKNAIAFLFCGERAIELIVGNNMEYYYIKETVQNIIKMLTEQRYEEIYRHDHQKLLSPSLIKEAIDEFGHITMPPQSAFEEIKIYETGNPDIVKIDFDLWFDFQTSDLTLSCAIYTNNERKYSIEGIHML